MILDKNYYTRQGELDLIARDGRTLVFVEVKYRKGRGQGYAEEAVTLKKQRSMMKAAFVYMHQHGYDRGMTSCRFDVVGITDRDIHWIKDAFWT